MGVRVATGAVFAVVILICIFLGGWALRAMILFAALTGMFEMYRALEHKGMKPVKWVGYLFMVMCSGFEILKAVFDAPLFQSADPILCALLISALLAACVVILRGKVDFDALVSSMFPLIYPGVFFGLMMCVQDMSDRYTVSAALVLMFFAASINDVFALLVGVRFGKHRLSPEISPKKSIEGSIGGIIACVIFAVLVPTCFTALWHLFPSINPRGYILPHLWEFALFGLVTGALSQIGDLTASLVKRHCGIKDYGKIFAGHGGMMDRMDGILFCSAVCWFFFHLIGA